MNEVWMTFCSSQFRQDQTVQFNSFCHRQWMVMSTVVIDIITAPVRIVIAHEIAFQRIVRLSPLNKCTDNCTINSRKSRIYCIVEKSNLKNSEFGKFMKAISHIDIQMFLGVQSLTTSWCCHHYHWISILFFIFSHLVT